MGTKIGCREGDCGACTVLVGELKNDEVVYQSFTSCLTPLGNVQGKHVVTVEGINMDELNPIQHAMSDCSATQCGFCTPGFVVSLAGFCLGKKEPTPQNAIASIDGNICRCTGYKSIERAAAQVAELLQKRRAQDPLTFVADNNILPSYFSTVKERLKKLSLHVNGELADGNAAALVGGGTDLYVQKHDDMKYADIRFMYGNAAFKGIKQEGNRCIIGASTTVSELMESPVFQQHFPSFAQHVKLVSSTPIRNMATIAGNFVNASPIGDFTIFFLALDATIVLSDGNVERSLPLRQFYKGYKQLDKKPEEFIIRIFFNLPTESTHFNFEKVSKRTHLDIASGNTAMLLKMKGNTVTEAGISAGGVGPVPMFLANTSAFLRNKELSEQVIADALQTAQSEVSPISDARGSAAYKRLLLSQLIKAHFITFFPQFENIVFEAATM